MLSKPKYGWTDISIENWSDRCSDICDSFPCKLLEAIKIVLLDGIPQVILCDAEGWEYYIIFDRSEIIISTDKFLEASIKENMEYKTFNYHIFIEDIAEEVVSDIRRNIDDWAKWGIYDYEIKEEILKNKMYLEEICNEIERLLR